MTKKRYHSRSVVAIAICLAAVVISSNCCKMDSVEDERIFGMSYHDNAVTVETTANKILGNLADPLFSPTFRADPWTITGGSFTMTNFDVTSGQDPNQNLLIGARYPLNSSHFVFTVGRKGSKDVAASFNLVCPPEHNTFRHTADELNFWMKGDMELRFKNGHTYTFPNTFFAQGHTAAVNNWWFGSDGMTNTSVTITLFDPYKSGYETFYASPPDYNGYGFISPIEDPNLVFLFHRGYLGVLDLGSFNSVYILGVYQRTP